MSNQNTVELNEDRGALQRRKPALVIVRQRKGHLDVRDG